MGLFDHLFKPKPDDGGERTVEQGGKPAAETEPPPGPGVFLQPKAFATRGGAPVQPTRHAPPPKPGPERARTPPKEIVLTLGDLLARIPTQFLKTGMHDARRELRFVTDELSSDIARGRATIALSKIAAQCPEVFNLPIDPNDDIPVRLPLQKLLDQLGLYSSRPAGPAQRNIIPGPAPVVKPQSVPESEPVAKALPLIEPAPVATVVPHVEPVSAPAPVLESVSVAEPILVVEPAAIVEPPPVEEAASVVEPAPVAELVPAIEPVAVVELPPIVEPISVVEPLPVIPPAPIVEPAPVSILSEAKVEEPAPVAETKIETPVVLEPAAIAEKENVILEVVPLAAQEAPIAPPATAKEPEPAPVPKPKQAPQPRVEETIKLSLAAIVARCPAEILTGERPIIGDSVRISFPFAPIERQIPTGVVEVTSHRFISYLPVGFAKYFKPVDGVRVPLPLEEIFQNLPGHPLPAPIPTVDEIVAPAAEVFGNEEAPPVPQVESLADTAVESPPQTVPEEAVVFEEKAELTLQSVVVEEPVLTPALEPPPVVEDQKEELGETSSLTPEPAANAIEPTPVLMEAMAAEAAPAFVESVTVIPEAIVLEQAGIPQQIQSEIAAPVPTPEVIAEAKIETATVPVTIKETEPATAPESIAAEPAIQISESVILEPVDVAAALCRRVGVDSAATVDPAPRQSPSVVSSGSNDVAATTVEFASIPEVTAKQELETETPPVIPQIAIPAIMIPAITVPPIAIPPVESVLEAKDGPAQEEIVLKEAEPTPEPAPIVAELPPKPDPVISKDPAPQLAPMPSVDSAFTSVVIPPAVRVFAPLPPVVFSTGAPPVAEVQPLTISPDAPSTAAAFTESGPPHDPYYDAPAVTVSFSEHEFAHVAMASEHFLAELASPAQADVAAPTLPETVAEGTVVAPVQSEEVSPVSADFEAPHFVVAAPTLRPPILHVETDVPIEGKSPVSIASEHFSGHLAPYAPVGFIASDLPEAVVAGAIATPIQQSPDFEVFEVAPASGLAAPEFEAPHFIAATPTLRPPIIHVETDAPLEAELPAAVLESSNPDPAPSPAPIFANPGLNVAPPLVRPVAVRPPPLFTASSPVALPPTEFAPPSAPVAIVPPVAFSPTPAPEPEPSPAPVVNPPPPPMVKRNGPLLSIPPIPSAAPQQPTESAPPAAPPPIPLGRFDQDTLQSLFMTEETLDLPALARRASTLPGVQACVLTAGGETQHAGNLPPGLDAATLDALVPAFAGPAEKLALGPMAGITLHVGAHAVSVFTRGSARVCAVHGPRGFLPGVREKFAALADALAS